MLDDPREPWFLERILGYPGEPCSRWVAPVSHGLLREYIKFCDPGEPY